MGIGDTVISGAYAVSDTTAIAAFIDQQVISTVSGATVWTYPGANAMQVYVGVTQLK